MPDEVDVNELDAGDLKEILGALKEGKVNVSNVAAARKEVTTLLAKKNLVLSIDEKGDFDLSDRAPPKGKGKPAVKAKPEPEPEPEEETEEVEEEAEEETEETEDEGSEEVEEEAEEEPEPEPEPVKKVAKKAAAPAAPAKKVVAKKPAEEEVEEEVAEEEPPAKKVVKKAIVKRPSNGADEEVEAAAPAKRKPPVPRASEYKPEMKIKVLKKDHPFQEGSKRALKMAALTESKTVADFLKKCKDQDLPTPSGFIGFAVKSGIASVS